MKKAATLAEVRIVFERIEENGNEWFSNLLARDEELTQWIEKGQVSIATTPTTALLLRQRYGCQRLYFANTKRETLAKDLRAFLTDVQEKVITTVLDRNGENEPVKGILHEAGFSHYALLKRIVKINEPKSTEDISVEYAKIEDLSRIEEILRRYFDPLLDHWPDEDEIVDAINQKRIIVARLPEDGQVVGICSFEKKGMTLWGRYLASIEEYRSRAPYGAILADQYLMLHSNMRKIIGWVGEDNIVSIRVNRALGFSFDGTTDETFIHSYGPIIKKGDLV